MRNGELVKMRLCVLWDGKWSCNERLWKLYERPKICALLTHALCARLGNPMSVANTLLLATQNNPNNLNNHHDYCNQPH